MSIDQTSSEVEQADGNAIETDSVNRENSPSPGARLAWQRQERGLSQKDVADKLHITIHYVNSIERDAYEKLPGTVFAKGYIRRYAELLDLDVEDYLQDFEQLQSQQQGGAQQQAIQRRRASGRRNRSVAFASMLLFVGVFIAVWYFSEGENSDAVEVVNSESRTATEAMEESDPVPSSTPGLAGLPGPLVNDQSATLSGAPAEPTTDTAVQETAVDTQHTSPVNQAVQTTGLVEQLLPGNQQTSVADDERDATGLDGPGVQQAEMPVIPAPVAMQEQDISPDTEERVIIVEAEGDDILRISFSGESWVEINDGSSNQIYRDLLEAGDILQITGTAPFNVLLGYAPFTELTFNGDEVDVTDNIRIDNSARLTVGL